MEFTCPSCNKLVQYLDGMHGRLSCPYCGGPLADFEDHSRAVELATGDLERPTEAATPRPPEYTPIDFENLFGPYVYRESTEDTHLRWVWGLCCLLYAFCAGMAGQSMLRSATPLSFSALSWILFVTAVAVGNVGMRLLVPRAESVLRRNNRRPIVYLRSFKSDARLFTSLKSLLRLIILGAVEESPELALARAVKNIGPLVAVGRPGEQLPAWGAARLYVPDQWQHVVRTMANEAALVIFRIGETEGFWWEFQIATLGLDPHRVFLYLPKKDRGRVYASFRARAAGFFPHALPVNVGGAMFLAFGPGWEPRLLYENNWSLWNTGRAFFSTRAGMVREAINLALKPLGLNARPLPLLWFEWFVGVVLIGMAILTVQCCGLLYHLATVRNQYDGWERPQF